jgi:hypothetical protein
MVFVSRFVALVLCVLPAGAFAQGPRILAHEWGVWRLENGRITHLEELAAELPPFVERAPNARLGNNNVVPPQPQGPFPNVVVPHPVVARKPVLFLYSDAPVDVTVEVDFTGGEPWLFFPRATPTAPQGRTRTGMLRWEGRLDPRSTAGLTRVDASHFWADLRAVGATPFVTANGSTEQFLFYDGPVEFRRAFQITRMPGGAQVVPDSDETALWLVDGRSFVESKANMRSGGNVMAQGDMTLLRARLAAELTARGLTTPEAQSLLETWRDDLFTSQRPRAIYFIPREWYDRMLPLRITPAPAEIVRVGVAIEML